MDSPSQTNNQWLFTTEHLHATPTSLPLERELYDRARGVEFLFRLGSSLMLPTSAMCTAATWFHRFYMRFSMDDFHRQDVAASCIFLATKTEECGRKLRDVARVYQAKVTNTDINLIPADSPEVDVCQTAILITEEVLLEALCFDFIVDNPHAELLTLFEACPIQPDVQEYAWSLAHDSYRTPMCILFSARIIATACYVLAQKVDDGPNSPSLDARIAAASPSKSLPTPPSHKPGTPDASRVAIEFFDFNEGDLGQVAEALCILIEFYASQDLNVFPYLTPLASVPPPVRRGNRQPLYGPQTQIHSAPVGFTATAESQSQAEGLGRTPTSTHGGHTPSTQPNDSVSITEPREKHRD